MSEPNDLSEFAGVAAEGPHGYKRDRADPIKPPFRGFELLDDEQREQVIDVREGRRARCLVELPDERVLIEHVDAGYLIEETGTRWGYTARRIRKPPRALPPAAPAPDASPLPPAPAVARPPPAPVAPRVVLPPPPPVVLPPVPVVPVPVSMPTPAVATAPVAPPEATPAGVDGTAAGDAIAPLPVPATPSLPPAADRSTDGGAIEEAAAKPSADAEMPPPPLPEAPEEMPPPPGPDLDGVPVHRERTGHHRRAGGRGPSERRHGTRGHPRGPSAGRSRSAEAEPEAIWRPEQTPSPKPFATPEGRAARAVVLWLLVALLLMHCLVLAWSVFSRGS